MLTPELMVEAIKTSHDECERTEPRVCLHEDAISGALASEDTDVIETLAGMKAAIESYPDHLFAAFSIFVHIGYRLRQLEEKQDIELMNLPAPKGRAKRARKIGKSFVLPPDRKDN